jgi:hypothetical protein
VSTARRLSGNRVVDHAPIDDVGQASFQAAQLAQGLTARPTQDLDFFTRPGAGDVGLARDQFLVAAVDRGWTVDRVQDSATFCRLLVHGPEDLLVDLALDSAPGRPASASIAGPTFAPDELAGRKMIALFDRAAARDFVDVHALSRRFTKTQLLDLAREIDSGFDTRVFICMLNQLNRYRDVDLVLGDVDIPALRAFFQQWITELASAIDEDRGDARSAGRPE